MAYFCVTFIPNLIFSHDNTIRYSCQMLLQIKGGYVRFTINYAHCLNKFLLSILRKYEGRAAVFVGPFFPFESPRGPLERLSG
jgi:hypothetical protein